jgi:hypothetical protein
MFARIGVMRALNWHVERVFDPSRKDKHWGRRKLARDRCPKCPLPIMMNSKSPINRCDDVRCGLQHEVMP